MEMVQYILSILSTQISVVMSWGFHKCKPYKNGISFLVQGFLFKGTVNVIYDEAADYFIVQLVNEDGSLAKERTDVGIDQLVNVIDELVEHCPDYKERVAKEYGLQPA